MNDVAGDLHTHSTDGNVGNTHYQAEFSENMVGQARHAAGTWLFARKTRPIQHEQSLAPSSIRLEQVERCGNSSGSRTDYYDIVVLVSPRHIPLPHRPQS